MNTKEYHESLLALVTLGLPLVQVPTGVLDTMELRAVLLGLETALLKVKLEVLKEQVAAMKID